MGKELVLFSGKDAQSLFLSYFSATAATGLRLRSGLQGLQKAAPEPLVENRQVTLPSCKPCWQPRRRASA